jgi:ribonuclease BN (tRNA processing enzyme)
MSARSVERLRLTVLGCSTATPHPAFPASGYLLEWGTTRLLLDAGQGVVRRLQGYMDPRDLSALFVGHMHADHYLDIVALRYLFPWGVAAPERMPVYVPPGGRANIDALASAVSERAGFFDMSYAIAEYDPGQTVAVGPLTVSFVQGRHYVPAWGFVVEAPDGTRIAYTGDTGPSEEVVEAVQGVDLLLVEAALKRPSDDDLERGHLSAEEAIALALRARVRSALLVHYAPPRRADLDALCEAAGPWVTTGVAGESVTIDPAVPARPTDPTYAPRAASSAASALDR